MTPKQLYRKYRRLHDAETILRKRKTALLVEATSQVNPFRKRDIVSLRDSITNKLQYYVVAAPYCYCDDAEKKIMSGMTVRRSTKGGEVRSHLMNLPFADMSRVEKVGEC